MLWHTRGVKESCMNKSSPSIMQASGVTRRLGGSSLSHLSPLSCKLEGSCMAPVSSWAYFSSPSLLGLQSIICTVIFLQVGFVSWL